LDCDVAIVGSGPSGAQAAKEAVEAGLRVTMLDVGFDEPALGALIPDGTFSELRNNDTGQRQYFLGQEGETDADVNDRIGGHFTPPRSFIKRGSEEYIPVRSQTFFPENSLALGGLGAGWGSGSQTFETSELERVGLPAAEMAELYEVVARDIGISAAREDDTAGSSMPYDTQSPSMIDTNAQAIFANYRRRHRALNAMGLVLGRAPLAMLTAPMNVDTAFERQPNPYYDMDFYSESARSIYRPKYTIEELSNRPNFRYVRDALVERFEEASDRVTVGYRNVIDGKVQALSARSLLLAANPLNSARIALRSARSIGTRQPLLCNSYHYIPAVNLAMLGRVAADRRHSLAQLAGSFTPAHRVDEHVMLAFYSYRSLMHFRLVREMPLPPSIGLLVSRVLMNALTIVGVHHPERATPDKWIRLAADDVLEAGYRLGASEKADIASDLRGVLSALRALRCAPLSAIATPPGSSIHYGGTIPMARDAADPAITCSPDGRLIGSARVFVADSSSWRYLPAKGPTFTMMANGRRVARFAARALRS
jgi:choline dehydrogenase-like flavoprotein